MERKNRKSGSTIFDLTLTPVQQGTREEEHISLVAHECLYSFQLVNVLIIGSLCLGPLDL